MVEDGDRQPRIVIRSLIDTLHPSVAHKARELIKRCAQKGIHIKVTSALRSYEAQNKLYSIGRTTGTKGQVVTNARGGYSWHNFGLAFDVVFMAGAKTTYKGPWSDVAEVAEELGLEWGGRWRRFVDLPHFQDRLGMTLAQARAAYKAQLIGMLERDALEDERPEDVI